MKATTNFFFTLAILFLKAHNAYDNYIINAGSLRSLEIITSLSPDECISGAFGWSVSPEGIDYWAELNQEWENLYNLYINSK